MKRSKLWIIIVVVLLLANTAVLAMLWFKKPQGPPPGGGAKDFLVKELNLTAEQQKRFDSLRQAHQDNLKNIMMGMREMKDSFFEMISSDQVDTLGVQALAARINDKEKQRDLATFYHFREFRKTLTAEQQNKFDKILKDVMRMMSGPQRPPQGPPGEKGREGDRPPPPGEGGPDGPPPHDN